MEKTSIGNLFRVARLQFLIAGLALFLLGGMLAIHAGAEFSFLRLVLGYLVIMPAQLSVHFSNDYFDVGSDRPGRPTLISGGGGVLLGHPELRQPVKWIAVGLIIFSLGMGLLFLLASHIPVWTFGFIILGNLLGWFYSAPPLRLSQRGWGEVCYTFIAGFLVPGMGYLALQGQWDLGGISFLAPLLLYGMVSILSVEIPDVEDDWLAQKRTWVSRMGRAAGFISIGSLLIVATGYFFLAPGLIHIPRSIDFILVGLLSLIPLSPGIWGMLKRPISRDEATRIATAIVISLAVFSILVVGYLFIVAAHTLH